VQSHHLVRNPASGRVSFAVMGELGAP